MKIITMCRGGNVRSVAAKMILSRYLNHEVIAIGADNTNNYTKKFLFDWADKIVVMSAQLLPSLKWGEPADWVNAISFKTLIPRDYTSKSILLDVGNDIWGDPFNEDLQIKIVNLLYDAKFNQIRGDKVIDNDKVLINIRKYKNKIKTRNTYDSAI